MTKTLSQEEYSSTHTETVGVLNFSAVHDAALSLLSPVKEKTILDLGCGNGELLSLIVKSGGKAYGIDYDPSSIAEARKIEGAIAVQGSITDPFQYEPLFFNGIVSLGTIGYLSEDDMQKTFKECNRVLIPGDVLVIRTPTTINRIGTFLLQITKKKYVTNTHFYPQSFYEESLINNGFNIASTNRSLDDNKDISRSFLKSMVIKILFPFMAPLWIKAIKNS